MKVARSFVAAVATGGVLYAIGMSVLTLHPVPLTVGGVLYAIGMSVLGFIYIRAKANAKAIFSLMFAATGVAVV